MTGLGHCAQREPRFPLRGVVLLLLLFAWPAQARQESAPPKPVSESAAPQEPQPSTREYLIGSQDLLLITILEAPELSREVRVAADGTVGLPLVERVVLKGLTLSQAEELLKKKYMEAGILNDPNISISVKDLQSRPVTVTGAVKQPGVFQVSAQTELLRLLTMAGGPSPEAGGTVQVIRAGTTAQNRVLELRLEDVRAGLIDANVPIYGGDTVNVVPAGAVYVVGAVTRPGRYLVEGDGEDFTVLRLVALAQDVTRTAKSDKAVLIRKDANGQLTQVPVDIRKILQQKGPDVALQANDVLYVPDSLAKRAFQRGLQTALQVATSVAIYGPR